MPDPPQKKICSEDFQPIQTLKGLFLEFMEFLCIK